MMNAPPVFPTTRREFLRRSSQGIGLLAFSHFAPSFLVQSTLSAAPAPEKDRTILVLVQLAGGNDGLNTVVPHADDHYHRLRPTLRLPVNTLLPLNDQLALHPACTALHRLYHDGQLAIVQNVGYPNPNRSHFRSMEIWETASASQDYLATGWVGRYLDNTCAGSPADDARSPGAIHLTEETPPTLYSSTGQPTFGLSARQTRGRRGRDDANLLEQLSAATPDDHEHGNGTFLRQTTMDALATEKRIARALTADRAEAAYPSHRFAQSLRNVAALIAAGISTRVYFVSLGGFDTHSRQANVHQQLLTTLSEGLSAFQHDLRARGLEGQVLTMTFSEFGRRPAENESGGTDHGTAAPLFVMGSHVRGPLHGQAPSLQLDPRQDLTFSTDFRAVYATVLDRWLQCPSAPVLGESFAPIPFV